MTEVAQVAAAPAAPQSLSIAQAALKYAEQRQTNAAPANPVSDAARTLGQQAARARQERQAQAAATQEPPKEEGDNVKDDPTLATGEGVTLNETATNEPPVETEANPEGESDEAQTIDLGDGLVVTMDEVRDGFMLKADHTKKTQAIAERAKALDQRQSQTLAKLDGIVSALEQKVGKPKSLKSLIEEFGRDEALEKYAEQEEDQKRLEAARNLSDRQDREFKSSKLTERDQHLAEHYNKEWSDPDKRNAAYTELTSFALKRGASPEELSFLPSPWMIEVLDLARQQVALQSNKGNVTKHIAEKPKVTRPGAKVSAQANAFNATQAAQAKLNSSGKLADAVALLRARRASRG